MFDTHVQVFLIERYIFSTPAYTFFVSLGLICSIIYYFTAVHKERTIYKGAGVIIAAALISGTIGAKIPLFFEGYTLQQALLGKSIVGGLIGGFLGVIVIKKIKGIKLSMGNIIAPTVALGLSIGRIGCFFNGCCAGIRSSVGIDFGDGFLRLPTQLFEVAFQATAFIVLHYYKNKVTTRGILFKIYLLSYFIFRYAVEFIRYNPKLYLGMSIYQVICLLGIVWIGIKLIKIQRRQKNENLPNV